MTTSNKPQVIVPSKFFRESVKDLYLEALKAVGITPKNVTVHIDSAATLNIRPGDYDALMTVPGIVQLSDVSRLGNIKAVIPGAVEFLKAHNPTEGTVAKAKAANPMTEQRKRDMAARREAREQLRQMLADLHGIGDEEAAEEDES